jgi:hypothetical protein
VEPRARPEDEHAGDNNPGQGQETKQDATSAIAIPIETAEEVFESGQGSADEPDRMEPELRIAEEGIKQESEDQQ